MNYGTISRKSSVKGKSARLPIVLCFLFFLLYFSFLFFFRYTQSVAFFQYLQLLFIVSTAVSLIYCFLTKKAWIPLILQLTFGGICWINYQSFQSDLTARMAEMEKIYQEKTLEAEAAEKTAKEAPHTIKQEDKGQTVLTRANIRPLLLVEKGWRFQVISLGEVIVSSKLHSPDAEFTNGKAGWTATNTITSGYYFGLWYHVSLPVPSKSDGIIRQSGSPQGDLIKINNGMTRITDWFQSGIAVEEEKNTTPQTLTLRFTLSVDIANGRHRHLKSIGSATWTYVPPAPKKEVKKNIEFR